MDRLSAFMSAFSLEVAPWPEAGANFLILGAAGLPSAAVITPHRPQSTGGEILFAARLTWGGAANPLLCALPGEIRRPLPEDADCAALAELILSEASAPRCGSASVLARLTEVLFVRILRIMIKEGAASTGLLGGLADPRISRALTALHQAPGRGWQNADLAEIAGLSPSRFAERFGETVGQPPAAYLRLWRLTLARRDLEGGARVEAVARRYAYGSGEAFARAYRKAFGTSPSGRAA